jgi:Trypsin-co-occurring domain 1
VAFQVAAVQMGGAELLVEVTPVAGSEPTSAKLDRAHEAIAGTIDRVQESIVAVAESTINTIKHLTEQAAHPDEIEVKFGLKFSAQGNVIVAAAAGDASLEITMTYRRDLAG